MGVVIALSAAVFQDVRADETTAAEKERAEQFFARIATSGPVINLSRAGTLGDIDVFGSFRLASDSKEPGEQARAFLDEGGAARALGYRGGTRPLRTVHRNPAAERALVTPEQVRSTILDRFFAKGFDPNGRVFQHRNGPRWGMPEGVSKPFDPVEDIQVELVIPAEGPEDLIYAVDALAYQFRVNARTGGDHVRDQTFDVHGRPVICTHASVRSRRRKGIEHGRAGPFHVPDIACDQGHAVVYSRRRHRTVDGGDGTIEAHVIRWRHVGVVIALSVAVFQVARADETTAAEKERAEQFFAQIATSGPAINLSRAGTLGDIDVFGSFRLASDSKEPGERARAFLDEGVGYAPARADDVPTEAAALRAQLSRDFSADDESVYVGVYAERPYIAIVVVPLTSRSGGMAALKLGPEPTPAAVAQAVLAEHSEALGIRGECVTRTVQGNTSVKGETVVRLFDAFDLGGKRARIYGSEYRVYFQNGVPEELRAETVLPGSVDVAALAKEPLKDEEEIQRVVNAVLLRNTGGDLTKIRDFRRNFNDPNTLDHVEVDPVVIVFPMEQGDARLQRRVDVFGATFWVSATTARIVMGPVIIGGGWSPQH